MSAKPSIDETDRRIVLATQEGLPLTRRPYDAVAEQLGLTPQEVIDRMHRMLDEGIIRRIGVVPNHYSLGYRGNGMSVWDLPDECVLEMGHMIGDLDYVSHCYLRPRFPPEWTYNLFAMVHGHDRDQVLERVEKINTIMGDDVRAHDVLFRRKSGAHDR